MKGRLLPLHTQHLVAPHPSTLPASFPALPPVVLLHGFCSSADEDFLTTGWAATLLAAGRDVITIDLPGHGQSPAIATEAEARTSALVASILEAIEGAGVSDDANTGTDATCDVIGYSLGARLAWALAARSRESGSLGSESMESGSPRVRRLVLGGLSPFEPFSAVDPEDLAAALGGATPQHPLVGMMAGMISTPGRDTASLARLIGGLAAEPFRPGDGGPTIPTLFVAGTNDDMSDGIENVAATLQRGSVTRVPGDHRGALDSPEFRSAAVEFLAN